ncbi:MAG: alpha/beta hydrolase [Candidatus Acidiferrales bacterium]
MQSVIFIVVVITGLVILAGWVYQQAGTLRDRKRYPAPGELVDLNGHNLHWLSRGEGSPTVVFESGLMSTVLSWTDIRSEIAKATRAVCYDRAGLGWSDPGPAPRDADQIVKELHQLLDQAQVSPPFILVGHSFGGLTTRLFAARYPKEVAGLVLIDPVVPGEWNPPNGHNQKRIRTGAKILRRATVLARFGLIRFVSFLLRAGIKPIAEPLVRLMSKGAPKGDGTSSSPLFWNLPPSERAMAAVFWVQPKFTETIADQLENFPKSAAQVDAAEDLKFVPITIISAANTPAERKKEHIRTAQLSECGTHLTATRSGHWIMTDEPEIVLQAIHEMIERARKPSVMSAGV